MRKLIFATHNPDKLREMRQLLSGLEIEILSAEEAGVFEDVVEDGRTFFENALKKAKFASRQTGEWAVADDSGFCIDALAGWPGLHSARCAGENASGQEKISFVLNKFKDSASNNYKAWFESILVLYGPNDKHYEFNGRVDGQLVIIPRGVIIEKLPFDMIFAPDGHQRTFAEMSNKEKNSLSHRGKAFKKLKKKLAAIS